MSVVSLRQQRKLVQETRGLNRVRASGVQVLVAEEDTVSVGQEVFVVDQSAQGGASGEAAPTAESAPAAPKEAAPKKEAPKKEAPKKEAPKQGQEAQAAKPAPAPKASPPPPQPKDEVACSLPHSFAVDPQRHDMHACLSKYDSNISQLQSRYPICLLSNRGEARQKLTEVSFGWQAPQSSPADRTQRPERCARKQSYREKQRSRARRLKLRSNAVAQRHDFRRQTAQCGLAGGSR